jgi:hypothetical protein
MTAFIITILMYFEIFLTSPFQKKKKKSLYVHIYELFSHVIYISRPFYDYMPCSPLDSFSLSFYEMTDKACDFFSYV